MASIRERSSATGETTWAVLYRDGKRQSSTTFATEKKADQFKKLIDALGVDKALKAMAEGDDPADMLTVGDLAQRFLAFKMRDVTERTHADYRRDVANWIEPWFGHRPAESIDEGDVQRWVNHMATKLAPKSVADRHMLLHSMYVFGKAKSRSLVTHNPCLETELPKPHKKPPKGTTVPEWRALLASAEDRNTEARDLILFLGSVGWRWSEAAALAVRDVEDEGDRVWVNVTRVFRIIENRQVLVEDAAKSFAGFRRVPVPNDEATAMLRRRVVGKAPGDYVFTNTRGRHWNQNTFLRNTWPAVLKDAHLGERKPTPHWLRHMAVAVLAAAGATADQIRRYVGHEHIETTFGTYGGMLGGLSSDVLSNADRILAGHGPRGLVVSGEVVDGVLLDGPDVLAGGLSAELERIALTPSEGV